MDGNGRWARKRGLNRCEGHRRGKDSVRAVVEAMVYAGLIDGRTARPSATYPRDLFFDASINRYLDKHLKLYPDWDPPARWTSTPMPEVAEARP